MQKLQEFISGFNTIPFIFAGSGITRRYYNLPCWKELLDVFARKVKNFPLAYHSYENEARQLEYKYGLLPKIASLIERDFNAQWFIKQENNQTSDKFVLDAVNNGCSPFKAEVSQYIKKHSIINEEYNEEIQKLKSISKKSISGIITTNYDLFFETLFDKYNTYIGQQELIFSAIQGIAEIYKIHGSVSLPNSIVITEQDYLNFDLKSKYLASKLMTIFVEYPIIFLGYSLDDNNIKKILEDIAVCLPKKMLGELQKRLVFVEYDKAKRGYDISSYIIALKHSYVSMTKITLSNFKLLYDVLSTKVSGFPVKILRRFKEEIYTYVITNKPGPHLKVSNLDNDHLSDEQIAISIGQINTGELGLQSVIHENDWYRSIVDDRFKYDFSSDQMLKFAYKEIKYKNKKCFIPAFRYLSSANEQHSTILNEQPKEFDDLFCKSDKDNRFRMLSYTSLSDLINKEKSNTSRMYRLMCWLTEEKYDIDLLKQVLESAFQEDEDILDHFSGTDRSNFKRLIRVYDYLKWGKDIIKKQKDSAKIIPLMGE